MIKKTLTIEIDMNRQCLTIGDFAIGRDWIGYGGCRHYNITLSEWQKIIQQIADMPDIKYYPTGDPGCQHNWNNNCWCINGDPEYLCVGVDACPEGKRIEVDKDGVIKPDEGGKE